MRTPESNQTGFYVSNNNVNHEYLTCTEHVMCFMSKSPMYPFHLPPFWNGQRWGKKWYIKLQFDILHFWNIGSGIPGTCTVIHIVHFDISIAITSKIKYQLIYIFINNVYYNLDVVYENN